MKKFGKTLLQFILFVSVAYITLLFGWNYIASKSLKPNLRYKKGGSGHTYSRLSEIDTLKNVDILFLGSSHAYRGFDPRIFAEYGYTSFNLGSSSQTPLQTKLLLDRYLKEINPKVVFYEVYPESFSSDGVESSLDILSNDIIDLGAVEMAFKLNNMKVYNTLLLAIPFILSHESENYSQPLRIRSDEYVGRGYVEKDVKFYKTGTDRISDHTEIKESQLKNFEENLKMLKAHNVAVFLIYSPITAERYSYYPNKANYDTLMSSYSEYLNFNNLVELNDSLHFYDSHHLNQRGVDVFNHKLIEHLQARIDSYLN